MKKKEDAKQDLSVTCYHCNKPWHIKVDCPKLKKSFKNKDKKKKAYKVLLDNNKFSSDEEPEERQDPNMCFMEKLVCEKDLLDDSKKSVEN